MKLCLTYLLIVSLLACSLSLTLAQDASFCGSKCASRCSKAGVMDRCLTYCGICCRKCECVPSGTYGNKSECPCYRDMVTPKGKPKCP